MVALEHRFSMTPVCREQYLLSDSSGSEVRGDQAQGASAELSWALCGLSRDGGRTVSCDSDPAVHG